MMLREVNVGVVRKLQKVCGLWGLLVGRYPVHCCVISLLVVAVLGCGLVRLNVVLRPYDLWVPENSEFTKVTKWKQINFPSQFRSHIGIWEADNILRASVIKTMWQFHKDVKRLSVAVSNKDITWEDVCLRIPTAADIEVEGKSLVCYEASLLEIWGFNESLILNLTDGQIVEDINTVNVSGVYGAPRNFSLYLGGLERDGRGMIIGAKTALHTWITATDTEAVEKGRFRVDIASGEKVDEAGMAWEKQLAKLADEADLVDVKLNMRAQYSLGSVFLQSLTEDAVWVGVGWGFLIVYVIVTLGRPCASVNRLFPSLAGLLSVALAILASYGACSMVGVPYGTLTNVLPVLLVALGVDDMYVIVTAWDSVPENCLRTDVHHRAQNAMEHAGMAVTVTSITNALAFIVSTSTDIPGLRWFCIYSGMGILMVYLLQVTLFLSAVVLNQRWFDSKVTKGHESEDLKDELRSGYLNRLLGCWGELMESMWTKGTVLIVTLIMLCFSSYNVFNISQKFDSMWLVPESSSVFRWYKTIDNLYPQEGEKGAVYFKDADIPYDIPKLQGLASNLSKLPEVRKVDAWFNGIDFNGLRTEYPWLETMERDKLCELLIGYLDLRYRSHFRISVGTNGEAFTEDGSTCATFKIEFQYVTLKDHKSKMAAMDAVRQVVRGANVRGYKAVWAHAYSQWETDKVILPELFKSMAVVLAVVGLMILILLASVRAAFFVLLCVLATLIDLVSLSYLWGLTVNTVTCIAFVLAIGICVDYASHIAHDFLSFGGTRIERVQKALSHMGSAVLHGGLSTLLAFVFLAPSDTYIYKSYFKILTGVAVFGLYHGIVLLPVLLSLFGPDTYPSKKGESDISADCEQGYNSPTKPLPSAIFTMDAVPRLVATLHLEPGSRYRKRTPVLQHSRNHSFPIYFPSFAESPTTLDRKNSFCLQRGVGLMTRL